MVRHKPAKVQADIRFGRVHLRPLSDLDRQAWQRIHKHFRDPEISHLNGTPPNRMPLWLLKRVLKADSRRSDRETYGIFDEYGAYIGTTELYNIRFDTATLGIIIGEKTHWSKGYGPEAISAILRYGFMDLGLKSIRLNTFGDNIRAQTAFKKVGFEEVKRIQTISGRIDIQMEIYRGIWEEKRRLNGQS